MTKLKVTRTELGPSGMKRQRIMIIRDAELRDARGIAEAHVRSWQAAYAGIVPDEDLAQLSVDQREQFWAQILSKGLRATIVLMNRDLVVGWSGFGPARDEDCDPILVAELYGIYLLPEYWRRSIGFQGIFYANYLQLTVLSWKTQDPCLT